MFNLLNTMKKSNNLKYKIFQLSVWLLLYSMIIIAVCNIIGLRDKSAQTYANRKEALRNDILKMEVLKNKFLLVYNQEYTNIESEATLIENNFSELSGSVMIEIDELINNSRSSKDSSRIMALTELKENVLSFSDTSEKLFDAVRETGNSRTGLISQWISISAVIAETLNTDNRDPDNIIMQLKILESAYLQTSDQRHLSSIVSLCDEMVAGFTVNEFELYGSLVAEYTSLTERINVAAARIKSPSGNGLLNETAITAENILNKITLLESPGSSGTSILLSTLGYVVILLLLISGIWLLIRNISASIGTPLSKAITFAGEIAKGPGRDLKLEPEGISEIKLLTDKLNNIASHLASGYRFVKSLNEGSINTGFKIESDSDILGKELLRAKTRTEEASNEQARVNEDNMRRRYINEGLAQFAGFLRAGDNMKTMGDNFILNLVKYLDAIQGGLFISEKGNGKPSLNLVSAFAYDRKKFLEKTINIGEGLVGTCAIEKTTMNLTEVPEGYISITSGLGDTPPDNLLLVPVVHEEELLGVVELASLRKFRDHEITFAEEVSKSLASTIVYTRNSEITSVLLKKSQQQAQEMAEQEEEMRQNMEELKATQEESARREEEYRGLIEALDRSVCVIEYNAITGLITEVNELTCKVTGLVKGSITGKTHQQVFKGSLITDEAFWGKVASGTAVSIMEDIAVKDKKIPVKHHFSPVTNPAGNITRYVNFAITDINKF